MDVHRLLGFVFRHGKGSISKESGCERRADYSKYLRANLLLYTKLDKENPSLSEFRANDVF